RSTRSINTSRIPKIKSTGDIGIPSIKLVLRKNKFNECRCPPLMRKSLSFFRIQFPVLPADTTNKDYQQGGGRRTSNRRHPIGRQALPAIWIWRKYETAGHTAAFFQYNGCRAA
ncbi:MAG TPA: hypothetical protein VNT00_01480, partial [Eoetvoesiella sp.]|uniref:hypothetical protein n=1 Tax=Eoetvoesiella sp. TaxID=1966355 RepID=UPI002C29BED7